MNIWKLKGKNFILKQIPILKELLLPNFQIISNFILFKFL